MAPDMIDHMKFPTEGFPTETAYVVTPLSYTLFYYQMTWKRNDCLHFRSFVWLTTKI